MGKEEGGSANGESLGIDAMAAEAAYRPGEELRGGTAVVARPRSSSPHGLRSVAEEYVLEHQPHQQSAASAKRR